MISVFLKPMLQLTNQRTVAEEVFVSEVFVSEVFVSEAFVSDLLEKYFLSTTYI